MERNDVEKGFVEFCKTNNIKIDDNKLNSLYEYYKLLIDWNEKINLTAITELNEVYIKHFEDSLLAINMFKTSSTLCDIGTGAGFPGLVLAIMREDLKITLVDSLQKRVNFLNLVISALNLKNVQVFHYRAEDVEFKNKYLNTFDYVVARAVSRLNTLTEYCLPYVKVGGSFIAYKSEKYEEEINESKKAINVLGGQIDNVQTISLNGMFRSLIEIKKNKTSEEKYPRGQNKPKLSPIK